VKPERRKAFSKYTEIQILHCSRVPQLHQHACAISKSRSFLWFVFSRHLHANEWHQFSTRIKQCIVRSRVVRAVVADCEICNTLHFLST